MTEQEIITKVNEVFIESFEIAPEKLQPQVNIFQDLGLDSLDIVDLVVALQNKFKIKIHNDERMREIRTLEDIHQFAKNIVIDR
ncbi:MAG: phosphopantetheine-binding protein [bacterium]